MTLNEQVSALQNEVEEKAKTIVELRKQVNRLYDVKKTADILNISPALVRQLIERRILPSMWIGKGKKVTNGAIEKFLSRYDGYDLRDLDNIRPL